MQKIVNLLNCPGNEYSKFATKEWYVIDSESKGVCSEDNPIKFLTKSIESNLCDYSDAFVLVTENIAVTRTIVVPAGFPAGTQPQRKQPLAAATKVASKNCAPFKDCRTEINEVVDNVDVTNDDNALSFKYKANLTANSEADGIKKGVKIAVPLKYLSNFWRSLEIPLINCKVELSLKWIENCVLTTAEMGANTDATGVDGATFEITDASFMFLVTLSAEDNVKLVKQLNEGFKRPVYWNKYKVTDNEVVEIAAANEEKHIRELPDSSYKGVKRFFALAYENTASNDQVSDDSFNKYFLPRVKIENYNIEIDGRNFYDQPINDLIKQYDEVRKVSIGQGDD